MSVWGRAFQAGKLLKVENFRIFSPNGTPACSASNTAVKYIPPPPYFVEKTYCPRTQYQLRHEKALRFFQLSLIVLNPR